MGLGPVAAPWLEVGWYAQHRMTTDLGLQALLSALWRRKPKTRVMVHSDQGSQFISREWQLFLSQHNLDAIMSRRGNCHDNAVAENFFHLLKRERIRRRTYMAREATRQDVFEYIEMFYKRSASTRTTACSRPLTSKPDSRN